MAEVVTGEAVVLEVPCARFPSRLMAIIVDLLIQGFLLIVFFTALTLAWGGLNAASAAALSAAGTVLILVGYPAIWETTTRGRSPGKFALGLRVVGDDGGPERFRQALVRGLAGLVEIYLLWGCPALICSLLSSRGKRLGDVFAGTFVIQQRLPQRRAQGVPAWVAPELAQWAAGLEMSRLTAETAETARRYLARLPELAPAAQQELGARIAAAVGSQVSPPPPPGVGAPAYLRAVLAERHNRQQAWLAATTPLTAAWYSPGAGLGQDASAVLPPGALAGREPKAATGPPPGVQPRASAPDQQGCGDAGQLPMGGEAEAQPSERPRRNAGGFAPPA